MSKKEALQMLNKELKERKESIRRGENVKDSRVAIELIKKQKKAIKRFL